MLQVRNLFFLFFISMHVHAQQQGFHIVENKEKRQVDVFYNGKLLTAYCYYDSSRKPILFPVNTVDGITVTRGFPFQPVAGDRTDHPHHSGIWLNYESVNGFDFWNNSTAIEPAKRNRYGTIVHDHLVNKASGDKEASLTATARWVQPDGKTLLKEETTYQFNVAGNDFIIDRITKLTAAGDTVKFKDVKDGFFAIRVARELEMPSKEPSAYVDDKGNITTVEASGHDVTGMYYNSEGLKGDDVWSSQGKWAMLAGRKDNREITIGIFDHPANVGYPAYWHARGYGLFSINPLGRKVFSNGKEELNFSLAPNQSTVFRYRVVVHSGAILTPEQMNEWSSEFEKKYK